MDQNSRIIISGSSITNEQAWPTWLTWIQKLYGLNNVVDLSRKGVGNKVIILDAINHALQCDEPPMIILQLTSVDKWDWYVEDNKIVDSLHKEKHPILFLDHADQHGFWSTGSHFPLWKSHFKEQYFSLEYQMFETLIMIQWFQFLCQNKGWHYQILFESPILSVTETQLNTGILDQNECYSKKLTQNTLCNIIPINFENIYLPGLIGYACLNNLPWFHDKFKSHPGSYVHYLFVKDVLSCSLDRYFTRKLDIIELRTSAIKFQNLLK